MALHEWPRRIQAALERDHFALHAQPIVELSSGRAVRYELFLRMMENDQVVPAREFVIAAEEHGSIREIDRWVVGMAIAAAGDGRPVSVNLSVRSIDGELLELITAALEDTGARPEDVAFELGESQLSASSDTGREFVHALKSLGCVVMLDDFVRGGDDLSLLERLPIDYLKMGAPFMHELPRDRARRHVVQCVVHLAERFGQRTIAGGVEDVATLQTLRELGVDEAQGYALGSPKPLQHLTRTAA
jgi:EAL domain-containing protein (putative c-di-GMP-specific phosphodiesterase class I)